MPIIYLSPSTQEYNPYVTGSGSEEYWMNRLADAMEPYLRANTIRFTRNTPDMTAAGSIAQANRGYYDFYLALHSNASGPESAGRSRGIIVFYYPTSAPTSASGRRAAEIFAENLRKIYPLPEKVTTQATTALGEVRRPKAPANLIEIGYHDNAADALWIEGSIGAIAEALVQALTEYFGLPFLQPQTPRQGTVTTAGGLLNLRAAPNTDSAVVARLPNGTPLTIYGQYRGWYSAAYGQHAGFVSAPYVRV